MTGSPAEALFRTRAGHRIHYAVWLPPGGSAALLEPGAPASAPLTILFVHATGFHARCWDRVVELLPASVRRRAEVVSVSLRNHGHSDAVPGDRLWGHYANDILELLEARRCTHVVGCGHSMGGHIVARLAAERPALFCSLLLVDPTIVPRTMYVLDGPETGAFDFVRRRRRYWASAAAMQARLGPREPYAVWQPDVLRDYCEHGLRRRQPAEDSELPWELCCAPETEADIYETGWLRQNDPYSLLPRITAAVWLLRAPSMREGIIGSPFLLSPTAPDLATRLPAARWVRDEVARDLTHFIPMQAPGRVADALAELVVDLATHGPTAPLLVHTPAARM